MSGVKGRVVIGGIKTLYNSFNDDVRRMKDLKDRAPRDNAYLFRKLLVSKIKMQDFPGAKIPLGVKYLQRKTSVGKDRRILISTGDYLKNIKVFKVRGENRYFVGPSPYTVVPGTKLSYADLGEILEKQRPHLLASLERTKTRRDANWRLIYNVYS